MGGRWGGVGLKGGGGVVGQRKNKILQQLFNKVLSNFEHLL